jgi:hypothetical protein
VEVQTADTLLLLLPTRSCCRLMVRLLLQNPLRKPLQPPLTFLRNAMAVFWMLAVSLLGPRQ